MGKKSRAKKRRRQEQGAGSGGAVQPAKPLVLEQKQKGIVKFFLAVFKAAVYLSLFAPLLVSQKFYFPFVGPKSLYFMALAEIAIFSWLGLILFSKKYRLKSNLVSFALIGFFVSFALSSFFGLDFTNSFWSKFERMTGLLMLIHLFGFFLALTAVFREEKEWRRLFALSLVCALLVGAVSFISRALLNSPELQKYVNEYRTSQQSRFLPLFQTNILTRAFALTYYLLSLAFAGWLVLKKKWRELAVFGCLAVVFLSVLCFIGGGGSTRGGSTIGNSSFMGTYLLFNLFLALYLFFSNAKNSSLADKGRGFLIKSKALVALAVILLFLPLYSRYLVSLGASLGSLFARFFPQFILSAFAGLAGLLASNALAVIAPLLGAGLFLFIFLFFRRQAVKNIIPVIFIDICYLASAIFLFLPVLLESARAATLSIIGGMVLFLLLALAFLPKRRSIKLLGKVLLAFALLAVLFAGLLIFKDNSPVRKQFVEKATRARVVVWQGALAGFKEKPLLGWGPENFEFVFSKHFNPCMFTSKCGGEIWFDRAHNIILDTLVSTGVLGFLTYIAVFLSAFFLLGRAYFKKRAGFLACSLPIVILIAYSVQNLTVFDMISSYLMFFLVLGFIAVVGGGFQTKSVPLQNKKQISSKKAVWLMVLAGVFFLGCFVEFIIKPIEAGTAVIDALRAEDTSGASGLQKRWDAYQRAFDSSPVGLYQAREFLAQNSLETSVKVLEYYRQQGEVPPQVAENISKELDLVIAELEKTIKTVPLDFRSTLRLAGIYNVYFIIKPEKLSLAEEYARRAIEISPDNQQGYWTLAQALTNQQKYEQALEQAQKAIDLEPTWLQSHQIAMQVAGLKGDREKQKQLLERALLVNGAWASSFDPWLIDNKNLGN